MVLTASGGSMSSSLLIGESTPSFTAKSTADRGLATLIVIYRAQAKVCARLSQNQIPQDMFIAKVLEASTLSICFRSLCVRSWEVVWSPSIVHPVSRISGVILRAELVWCHALVRIL